jgi:hypothetical protein
LAQAVGVFMGLTAVVLTIQQIANSNASPGWWWASFVAAVSALVAAGYFTITDRPHRRLGWAAVSVCSIAVMLSIGGLAVGHLGSGTDAPPDTRDQADPAPSPSPSTTAPQPSATPPPASEYTHDSTGAIALPSGASADLDAATAGGAVRQEGSDDREISWTAPDTVGVANWKGALGVPPRTGPITPDACAALTGHGVELPPLKAGLRFCTWTSSGKLAMIIVRSIAADRVLHLDVELWTH